MSKRELIDAIRQHNRTVAPEYLARFAETDLKAYLDRVCTIEQASHVPRIDPTVNSKQELVVA